MIFCFEDWNKNQHAHKKVFLMVTHLNVWAFVGIHATVKWSIYAISWHMQFSNQSMLMPANFPILGVSSPYFLAKKHKKQTQPTQNARNHQPNFKKTHQNVTQTKISSIPCKSPNLPQPTYLPPQLQLPVCCHVTVLGPKCPSILAILRLINSTLPMYMLARGTWIPPQGVTPGDPGKVFFGRDLFFTEGKNSQAVVGCV